MTKNYFLRNSKMLNVLKYVWESFHAYLVSITFVLVIVIYYLYSLFSRYYIDVDVYISKLINGEYDVVNSSADVSGDSQCILQLSAINKLIDEKKNKEAVNSISKLQSKLGENSLLSKYLTIRKAIIMIDEYPEVSDYQLYLKSNMGDMDNKSYESLLAMHSRVYSKKDN